MSVINRVLKDLDHQGGLSPAPVGVRAVPPAAGGSAPRRLWLVAASAALAAAVWWFWPAREGSLSAAPSAPVSQPATPEARPQLRLSAQLGEVPPQAPRPHGEAKTAAVPPAPAAGVATQSGPAPTSSSRGRTVAARLDARLPEPARPAVVKEIRTPSEQEQAEVLWRQASRLVESGHGRDAMERLGAVLKLDASHKPARQTLIALALELGERERAEALLKEGMALYPRDLWFPRSLAQLHLQRGEHAQAAAILRPGLEQGADAPYWGLYAATLAKLGRMEDAAQAYREALRADPGQGPWWIGLGVALEQAGHKAEAKAAYQRALQTRLAAEVREFASQKALEPVLP